MIVAGIDVGGKNIHIVIKKDDWIMGKIAGPTGFKKADATDHLYDTLLREVGLTRKSVERVIATGSSAKRVGFANGVIADVVADARGVIQRIPAARTIIDIGSEEGRAIKIDANGKVLDFAMNEKCASGTGTFVETMARALEVTLEEMAMIALQSEKPISINAQCAVFGESEVVSLIHQKVPKADMARAVLNAIAGRIASLTRIIGLEKEIILVGGMAKNEGFVDSFKKYIEMEVIVPEDPDYMGALGAAEVALEEMNKEKAKMVPREKLSL